MHGRDARRRVGLWRMSANASRQTLGILASPMTAILEDCERHRENDCGLDGSWLDRDDSFKSAPVEALGSRIPYHVT